MTLRSPDEILAVTRYNFQSGLAINECVNEAKK